MRKKKDIPLIILKTLEPFVKLKGKNFNVIEPRDYLLHIVDKDIDSNFSFIIEKYSRDKNNGKFIILMTRSPKSENDNSVHQTWISSSSLSNEFTIWLKLLEDYDTVESFFDDPILKNFQEEFYSEFEDIDDADEKSSLTSKQVLLLDNYLEQLDKSLNKYVTEENKPDLEEIKNEILDLQKNLTKRSKKWVIQKLTTVWSKIAKQGTKFIKEFLSESKKEVIKQGVRGVIELAKESATDLLN